MTLVEVLVSQGLLVVAPSKKWPPAVRTITTASEWLLLFGYALGEPPRELWPKYGRWDRTPGAAFTLTDEQIREWRRGR